MILRLREAHISNLEKARSAEGVTDLEAETIVRAIYLCVDTIVCSPTLYYAVCRLHAHVIV